MSRIETDVLINAGVSCNDRQISVAANRRDQVVAMPYTRSTTGNIGWSLAYPTFRSTAGVPAVKQDQSEQCISEHRKSLVRFSSAHSGGVKRFYERVGVREGVADSKLNGIAGCSCERYDLRRNRSWKETEKAM